MSASPKIIFKYLISGLLFLILYLIFGTITLLIVGKLKIVSAYMWGTAISCVLAAKIGTLPLPENKRLDIGTSLILILMFLEFCNLIFDFTKDNDYKSDIMEIIACCAGLFFTIRWLKRT